MPMRRPLLGIAVAFITGAISGFLSSYPGPSVGAAFGLIALLLGYTATACSKAELKAEFFSNCLVFVAIFLVGYSAAGLRALEASQCSLSRLMDKRSEGVELVGVVVEEASFVAGAGAEIGSCRFEFDVESIRRLPEWQKARGRVTVSLRTDVQSKQPAYGERWQFFGSLTDDARDWRPDSGAWKRGRAQLSFKTDRADAVLLSAGHGNILKALSLRLRGICARSLSLGIEHNSSAVAMLRALLLGCRNELEFSTARDFRVMGAYHVLAISGLHVGILSLFIITLLAAFGLPRIRWFIILAPCLAFYTLMTGMRPSTVRGAVMAALFFLGPTVGRKTDMLSSLAFAALLILGFDPSQVFDLGFILSFTVVAGLLAITPRILSRFEPLVALDPFRAKPIERYRELALKCARSVIICVAGSLAAWLVVLPMMARWFNLFSPGALLANLIIIPLTPFILLAGWLAVLLGPWAPKVAAVFNSAGAFLIDVMTLSVQELAQAPLTWFYVKSPPMWFVALWYVTLAAWIMKHKLVLRVGVVCLVLATACSMAISPFSSQIHLFNIGGTGACFIEAPGGQSMLVNAGPRRSAGRLMSALRAQGLNSLGTLVIAQPDASHAGGAQLLLREIPIRELWCASTNMRSSVFKQALAEARKRGVKIVELKRGDCGTLSSSIKWSALSPEHPEEAKSAADAELTLLFEHKAASLRIGSSEPGPLRAARDGASMKLLVTERGALLHSPSVAEFDSVLLCVSGGYQFRLFGQNEWRALSDERGLVVLPDGTIRISLSHFAKPVLRGVRTISGNDLRRFDITCNGQDR